MLFFVLSSGDKAGNSIFGTFNALSDVAMNGLLLPAIHHSTSIQTQAFYELIKLKSS